MSALMKMRTSASALMRPRGVTPQESNVRDLQFTQYSVLTHDDLSLPPCPHAVFASSIQEETNRLYKKANGLHVQRRTAWRAHARGVDIFVFERLMGRRADGKFTPNSSWSQVSTRYFELALTKNPLLTTGNIRTTAASFSHETSAASVNLTTTEQAMSVLPVIVSRGFEVAVPTPEFSDARVLRTTTGSTVVYTVDALRIDGHQAVALHAVLNNDMWSMTQVNYTFSANYREVTS